MATVVWRGDAVAVAQVDTLTPGGTIEVGDIFNVTINGKTVAYVATGTTVASVCTGLVAALKASTVPVEFTEINWTDNTTNVTATAKTPGKPFTLTVTTTETGGGAADFQTFTRAATTANSGPNNWDVAANWSGAAVPVNADDVVIENTNSSILYGLAQSAVTLTSLTIHASFTGQLGLPRVNPSGYVEYRDTYLAIGSTTITVGNGTGAGSGRIKINTGTVQTALSVISTGTSAEAGVEAVLWKGTHASGTVEVTKGSVGVAVFAGETATIATLRLGYQSNPTGDVTFRAGSGTTLGTIEMSGGTVTINGAVTTVTMTAGVLSSVGSGAATTLNVYGGTLNWLSSGTITTLNIGNGGKVDFTKDMSPRTVSACDIYGAASIKDSHKTVTWTAGIDLNFTSLTLASLDLGTNHRITPAAVA